MTMRTKLEGAFCNFEENVLIRKLIQGYTRKGWTKYERYKVVLWRKGTNKFTEKAILCLRTYFPKRTCKY